MRLSFCAPFARLLLCVLAVVWSTASDCHASMGAQKEAPKRPRVLIGTPPVNVNMAGGGTLPKGVLYTALNASFADKARSERGGGQASDVFSQVWLLKVRYGLTEYVEINTVGSYVNLSRSNPTGNPEHLEGLGDLSVGVNVALYNIHQGDPFALSFVGGIILPTAPEGKNHLPGNNAWGGRATAAYGQFLTPDLKLDVELVWTGPFERGNQKVRRGDVMQWNTQVRYLFQNFDVAVESNMVHADSGNKRLQDGSTRNIRNGYTEWFVGPSMNIALPCDSWLGLGVFLPVYQHVKGPAKVEDARFEFKLGKLW